MTEEEKKLKDLERIEKQIESLQSILASGVREVADGSRIIKYSSADNVLKAIRNLELKKKQILGESTPFIVWLPVQGEIK